MNIVQKPRRSYEIRSKIRSAERIRFPKRSSLEKSRPCEGFEILFELCDRACAEERGGHDGEPQDPGDGHLRNGLSTSLCDLIERLDFREVVANLVGFQKAILRRAGVGWNFPKVAARELSLSERRKDDAADAFLFENSR